MTEVSDNLYPITFPNDIDRGGEMVLSQDLIFNWPGPFVSAYLAGRRFRNLLNSNNVEDWQNGFDPNTVQLYPRAVATTNDVFLLHGPVALGVTVGVSNFTRTASGFDVDPATHPSYVFSPPPFTPQPAPVPGKDPLRKATRIEISPVAYTTLRPFDVFSLVPSARYYSYFYSFHQDAPNLERGYLLLQADLSTQLEKVFETGDPDQPKTKHLFRPMLTYSLIPNIYESQGSPFINQINYSRGSGIPGYYFDDNDIVPIDRALNDTNNYFVPLGNSLAYGFTTQLIRRYGGIDSPGSGVCALDRMVSGPGL